MSFQSHHMLRLATTSVDHKPTTTAPRPTRFDQPDPALIRADLEAMRQDFQELLYALSDRDLRQRRFASAACSVSDLLTQTIAELARIPATVDGLRQDRKVERMPAWLFILLRIVRSRLGGPRTTCASLRDELDRAMDVALVALESIQGEEWQLGASVCRRLLSASVDFYPTNLSLCEVRRHHPADPGARSKARQSDRCPTLLEVNIAPSTAAGKPTGPAIHARVRQLSGDESADAANVIARKYPIIHGFLIPSYHRLRGLQTVQFEVTPVVS